MCEVKWIKINTNMFESNKLRLIEAMENKETIINVWIRLLVQAGKTNDSGYIYFSKDMPYTNEMLGILFGISESLVENALATLVKYEMIDINDKNYIRIINWEKHQNVEGMERVREQSKKRMQKYREKKKKEESKASDVLNDCSDVTVTEQIESKKENKELDKENENNIVAMEEVKKEKRRIEKISEEALKLIAYYEKITGKVGIFGHESIVIAIDTFGEKYVKMAIDKAMEVKKINMTYVNGILRNWAKEGYPKEGKGNGKGECSIRASEKFKDFKPKEARELSDEERRIAESELI
ncbi:phage replisome organizer N-terminal domain-containing protein [Clostridium cibarium]|uniref:Phage replisome organizer N-terminal domain-containing protein n=1 Tax=Clostridium cibarium TaxID=2762247 RepID=A0ABR8PW86_9CLOT|nr:phage replisome organizer N-terminal domain-containing protein [Clostridium cibarium]MBD7912447.1 phage replisome organizer N-terminal domain-containing protein [Clostridium cibarium]